MFIFFFFPLQHFPWIHHWSRKLWLSTEFGAASSVWTSHLFAHSNIKIPIIETIELMKFEIYEYDTWGTIRILIPHIPSPIIFLCRRDRYEDYAFGEFLLLMVWMLYHSFVKKKEVAINILNYSLFLSSIYTQVIVGHSFIRILFQFHF